LKERTNHEETRHEEEPADGRLQVLDDQLPVLLLLLRLRLHAAQAEESSAQLTRMADESSVRPNS